MAKFASMRAHDGIVADGFWRARTALEPHVRRIVEDEYAARLAEASETEKAHILREIRQEIRRRVRAQSPWYGLY